LCLLRAVADRLFRRYSAGIEMVPSPDRRQLETRHRSARPLSFFCSLLPVAFSIHKAAHRAAHDSGWNTFRASYCGNLLAGDAGLAPGPRVHQLDGFYRATRCWGRLAGILLFETQISAPDPAQGPRPPVCLQVWPLNRPRCLKPVRGPSPWDMSLAM